MSKQRKNLADVIQGKIKKATSGDKSYPPTNLNGWDYVVAVSQRHVNGGLDLLYEGGHLPKSFAKKESILGMEVEFKGDFGRPRVHAVADGLKLCDLVLPLENATMQTAMGSVPIPRGATLRITTSLVALEAKIVKGKGKAYDVFIDVKNENAAYNVNIDGLPKDQVAVIESLLKKEMQALSGREYLLTSYTLEDRGVGDFIPRLVDFSFVLNKEDPDASPFVLACATNETGPIVENRLLFASDVLPEGLPAALWLGDQHFMGEVLLRQVRKAVRHSYRGADLTYAGKGKIVLKEPVFVKTIKEKGRTFEVTMTGLDFRASRGKLRLEARISAKPKSKLHLEAEGRSWGRIEIEVSKDRRSFRAKSVYGDEEVKVKDTRSKADKIASSIFTLGIIDAIRAEIKRQIRIGTEEEMAAEIGDQFKDMAKDINRFAAHISSLQELNFDGNLLFDRFRIYDSGDVCVGIIGTERA